MSSVEKWRLAKNRASDVERFLALVGKPQRTTAHGIGHIHSIVVNATIYHQETDGAKNYHDLEAFNAELGLLIKDMFPELSKATLERMREKARHAAIDAQAEVQAMMDEINKAQETQS